MSKSRAKGTLLETAITTYLQRSYYPGAKRNPLAGTKDVGDIYLPGETRYVIEVKNCTRQELPKWVAEAQREALNFDPDGNAIGVVVHKRHGNAIPEQQWVTLGLGDFMRLVNELSVPSC